MAAAASAPAYSLRLRPRSTVRLLLFCASQNPRNLSRILKTPTIPPLLIPSLIRSSDLSSLSSQTRFGSGISSAISSADPKKESADSHSTKAAGKVRQFRKRLRIADIKGGPDEGLDRIGQELLIRGWVGACRAQRSITFIEVDSGLITTGTSISVEGILVRSQGFKQKVEMKVAKITMIGKSDPSSFPIQKKRVSREFFKIVAHLRPQTNTFGEVAKARNALAYATLRFFQENGFV